MTVIAAYNFDNALEGATVYDDTGNHNGVVDGTVALADGPVSSQKRVFTGVSANNRLQVPHHADFDISAPFSVEVWTTLSDSSAARSIVAKGNYSVGNVFAIFTNTSGQAYCGIWNSATVNRINTTPDAGSLLSLGVPRYVVATADPVNKTLLLYVDGYLRHVGAENGTFVAGDTSEPLVVGVMNNAGVYSFPYQGDHHAVRWHDVVLTPKHVYDTFHGTNIVEEN